MKKLIISLVLVLAAVFGGLMPSGSALAAPADCTKNPAGKDCPCEAGSAAANSAVCKELVSETKDNTLNDNVQAIINTLLYIVGVLAVIMIIVGAIRLVMSRGAAGSGGSAGAVNKARQTITYSVVGLVVAMLAWVIVNWVIDRL